MVKVKAISMPKKSKELEEVEEGTTFESKAIVLPKALMRNTCIKDVEVVVLKPICLKNVIPTLNILSAKLAPTNCDSAMAQFFQEVHKIFHSISRQTFGSKV